jgi:O-antigen/teichoic acid export membrane protein
LFCLFVNLGFDQALQQRGEKIKFWRTDVLLLSLASGIGVSLLMFASAPLAAYAYGLPELQYIIMILAAGLPFQALTTVSQVHLQSLFRFKFIAGYNCIEIGVSTNT